MKAIPLSVYRQSKYKGCSNISDRFDEILIECDYGNIDIDPDNLPENLCVVVTRRINGYRGSYLYHHIEPYKKPLRGGWMMGGNYASSSDARFFNVSMYPLAIHDREE